MHDRTDGPITGTPLQVQLLGGLALRCGDVRVTRFRTQKTAALLGYLAFYRRQVHSREHLIELLWPEGHLDAGRNSLSTALSSLRRQLEEAGLPAGDLLLA